jgi:putative transposase
MTQSEKMEIITLVEQSPLSVKATLRELGINRSTFYEWYKRYLSAGFDGLADSAYRRTSAWNQLPPTEKGRVVELAFERPDLSCRELACYIVDNEGCRAAGAVCIGVYGLSYPEKPRFNYDPSLPIDGSSRSVL